MRDGVYTLEYCKLPRTPIRLGNLGRALSGVKDYANQRSAALANNGGECWNGSLPFDVANRMKDSLRDGLGANLVARVLQECERHRRKSYPVDGAGFISLPLDDDQRHRIYAKCLPDGKFVLKQRLGKAAIAPEFTIELDPKHGLPCVELRDPRAKLAIKHFPVDEGGGLFVLQDLNNDGGRKSTLALSRD